MHIEQDLERAKSDLALKPDFNMIDTFRMFDYEAQGIIRIDELNDGLRSLGLFPTN